MRRSGSTARVTGVSLHTSTQPTDELQHGRDVHNLAKSPGMTILHLPTKFHLNGTTPGKVMTCHVTSLFKMAAIESESTSDFDCSEGGTRL